MNKLLDFSICYDHTSKLIALESDHNFPFYVKRVYYICDTDAVVVMEKHIHRKLEQMNISIFEGGFYT